MHNLVITDWAINAEIVSMPFTALDGAQCNHVGNLHQDVSCFNAVHGIGRCTILMISLLLEIIKDQVSMPFTALDGAQCQEAEEIFTEERVVSMPFTALDGAQYIEDVTQPHQNNGSFNAVHGIGRCTISLKRFTIFTPPEVSMPFTALDGAQ